MSQSNLSRLISPRSIAVVGHRGADFAIRGSLKLGYNGKIWAVHPSRETIEGLECYKSVRDLPEPPDATFIAVNAEAAIEIVTDLRQIGGEVQYCMLPVLERWAKRESKETRG